MHKKILIGLLLAFSLIISFTTCYANDELQKASNSAKNVVGGAENAVENAAKGAGNAVKDATNSMENGANKAGSAVVNGAKSTGNAVKEGASNAGNEIQNSAEKTKNNIGNVFEGNRNYTATRTSGEGTFMGMTSNTWSWVILGVATVAIIALVWYYSVQLNNNRNDDDE